MSLLTSEGLSCLADILIPELHEFPLPVWGIDRLFVYLFIYGFFFLFFFVGGGVVLNLTNETQGVCLCRICFFYGAWIAHYQDQIRSMPLNAFILLEHILRKSFGSLFFVKLLDILTSAYLESWKNFSGSLAKKIERQTCILAIRKGVSWPF